MNRETLLYEIGSKGRTGYSLPEFTYDKKIEEMVPQSMIRKSTPELPEVSELDVVRHFTNLSRKNFGVDTHFYPLGSCTMKYNPKVTEVIASLPGLQHVHPYQPEKTTQGMLKIYYEMEQYLSEICGMDAFTLQPAAGAHGEFLGMLLASAYFKSKKEKRTKVIIPDSAHGTNPSSAHIAGFDVITIKSNEAGEVDPNELKKVLSNDVAALMMTNPNTLGLFERKVSEIADLVHSHGALLYYDGANLNPLMGITNPGLMGFDIVHVNLHKTFSTPHGGGGPGSGPVGVKKFLEPFLPVPRVTVRDGVYSLKYNIPQSIGRIKAFYGNSSVVVKAYAYIKALGAKGLKDVALYSILNANYIKEKLKDTYFVPYERTCMHEFVCTSKKQLEKNIHTVDIAKALIDRGIHPPTIYFPLIVPEAMMIEPTETESKETLDTFIAVMKEIDECVKSDPESIKNAPTTTPVGRLDEVKAAREPNLCYGVNRKYS
ncbi:MAG: aminomethyl-transferring glycine dehydrogenase subunit GcvPB [Candidatus Ancaeobacter aquaticus]|nr:aminomethyl-transferring glycine dehydrogenase subunit GcvPB [Candidatus Ancaeobacter aquaticus]